MNLTFLEKLKGAHLLVAGEVGIDEYIWGDTRRISPEAPVPIVEVESQSHKLGLAANVAQNITSLGGRVTLVSVRGNDRDGEQLERMLGEAGIRESSFVIDPTRPTLRKVRVVAQRQHVVRIDYEKQHSLNGSLSKDFRDRICDSVPQCDGIILQDYAKGLWNGETTGFVQHAKAHRKPVFVDPSRLAEADLYKGTTLLTPNIVEAERLSGVALAHPRTAGKDDDLLLKMAERILAASQVEHVIITCGESGMVALSRGEKRLLRIPTFARDVFDVTGAGDTVISVLALTYVIGLPLADCMRVANAAAGIVVARIGTATVTAGELKEELERLEKTGALAPR